MDYPTYGNTRRDEVVSLKINGDSVIKVRASVLGGEQDVANVAKFIQFKEVTDMIEKIADSTIETIKKVKPDKASIEFGIEVAIESGVATALLVKGSGTGNFKITLEWSKEN